MTAHGPLFVDYQPIPPATEGDPVSKFNDYTEPARIRAIVTAIVGLAAALGLTLPIDLPGAAEVLIPVLAFVLPLIQGETTRAVVSPAKRAAGPQVPGVADHAA